MTKDAPQIDCQEDLEKHLKEALATIERQNAIIETQNSNLAMQREINQCYRESMIAWKISAERNLPIDECLALVRRNSVAVVSTAIH